MATVTATPTAGSLTVRGTTQKTGTISWTAPSVPSNATISSCVLTGTATATMSRGAATITVNGTTVTSGTQFSIDLGTANTTTSVTTTAKGGNKNATGTVSFSNLNYTVTYEVPTVATDHEFYIQIANGAGTVTLDADGTVLNTTTKTAIEDIVNGETFTIPSTSNNITINFTPASGYALDKYKFPEEDFLTDNPYTTTFDILSNYSVLTVYFTEGISYYTVTFKDYDGRIISSYSGPLNSMFTVPKDPVRDGYTFSCWSHAELGEFTTSQLEETTPELLGAGGDVEFTAVYRKYYTITAEVIAGELVDGGTITPSGNVIVYEGDSETFTIEPDSGYEISSILVDDVSQTISSTYTFTNVQSDHTIQVSFEPASTSTYTVTFKDYNGTVLKTETVEEGGSVTAPSYPTRDGYLCIGWDNDYSTITSDLDITAQYVQEQGVPSDNIFPTFTSSTFNKYDSEVLQVKDYSISLSTPKGVGSIIMPLPTEWLNQEITISVGNKNPDSDLCIAGVYFNTGETHTITPTTDSSDLVFYPNGGVKKIWVTDLYATMSPTYNIKYKLIQCTVSDNTITTVQDGSSFNTTITPVDGRTIEEFTIRILMGGVDITQSVVSFSSNDYTLSIPDVSGDIEIIAYVGTLVTIAQGAVNGSAGDGSFYENDNFMYFKSIRTDYIDISRYSSITMYVNDPAGFVAYNRYNSTKSYVNSTDLDPIVSGLYTYNTISDDDYIIFDMAHEDAYNYADLQNAPEISVEDYICSYEFVSKVYHTINVTHNEGGTVDCDSTIEVENGSSKTITFTPNDGYVISNVIVDEVSQGAITSYTFSNVTFDHSIQAVFEQIPSYTITASSNVGGSISPAGETVVLENGSQSYTISTDIGYKIKDVLIDGVSQGAITSYTFTNVTANHTIEVVFESVPIVVAAIEKNIFYAIKVFEGYDNFSIGKDGVYLNQIIEDLNEDENIYLDNNANLHVYQFIEDINYGIFNPETDLKDFEYESDGSGSYTLTGWKGTLNGEPSEEMIIPDNKKIIL